MPVRAADDGAEIAAMKVRLLVGDDVCLDVAEGSLGFMLDAFIEGLDDVFLEGGRTWKGRNHGLADGIGIALIGQAEHVHLDARGRQGDYRMHEFRDAGRGM